MGQVRSKSIAQMAALRRARAQRVRSAKRDVGAEPRYAKAQGWPLGLVGAIVLQSLVGGVAVFSADAAAVEWRVLFGTMTLLVVAGLALRSRRAFDVASALMTVELLAVFGSALHGYVQQGGEWMAAASLANFGLLPVLPGGGDVVLSTFCPALTLWLLTRQRVRDCFGLPVWA